MLSNTHVNKFLRQAYTAKKGAVKFLCNLQFTVKLRLTKNR